MLLLLGLYTEVIAAVNAMDWRFLAVLACGCVSGLLLFTRVLGWLLHRCHDALLALLAGFMSTALVKLWPWQSLGAGQEQREGGFFFYLRWPNEYALEGGEAFVLLAVLAGSAGGLSVWLLSRFARGDGKKVCQLSMDECVILSVCLAGCIAPGSPVVTDRSVGKPNQTTYTVARGDTLYSIAWRFDLDYRRLAAANKIGPPYTIIPPGTALKERMSPRCNKSERRRRAKAPGKPKAASKQVATPEPAKSSVARRSEPPRAATKALPKPAGRGSKTWYQPLPQKPSAVFGKNNKGLDYAISSRARVRNTRSGEVVYAGNGIAGFERLVIVKHSSELLSAYSFYGKLLVDEQQRINGGMVIAEILPNRAWVRHCILSFDARACPSIRKP